MIEKIHLICNKHGITVFKKRGIKKERFVCCKCDSAASKKYLRNLKQKCVDYKGGCCEVCGYKKCLRSLVFHHKNPLEKDFAIGESRPGFKKVRNFEEIKSELDKCQLLCGNCHNEIHDFIDSENNNEFLDLKIHKKNINTINQHIIKGRFTPEQMMEKINQGQYDTKKELNHRELMHEKWIEKNK